MHTSRKFRVSHSDPRIGIIVDAGPVLGYDHAVRCLRLATALSDDAAIVLYPLSESCREFFLSAPTNSRFGIRNSNFDTDSLPPLVITDLREARGVTALIHRQGSRHISVHDLGLAQCRSDVAIDGSVTRLFPFAADKDRALFVGPQYMIARERVMRGIPANTVLIAFGGGSSAEVVQSVSEEISRIGFNPVTTRGSAGSAPMSDEDLAHVMSTCRFAISGAGVMLYELVSSGVPTIAVALNRIQLRTADAFHERGAVLSAGLMERLSPGALLRCCTEMLENRQLVQRMTEIGQLLVDGKGLSRVVEIVRRQLWLTSHAKTFTTC